MSTSRTIEIFAPRWHDRKALIAKYKVTAEEILVKFTKAGSWNGVYSISSRKIKECSIDTNGSIECYAVPLMMLNRVSE